MSFVRWRRRRRWRRWIHQLNHDDIHISNCLSTEAVEETTLKENMSLNTLAHSYRCWKRQLDMSWLVHNVSYYLNLQHAHLRTDIYLSTYLSISLPEKMRTKLVLNPLFLKRIFVLSKWEFHSCLPSLAKLRKFKQSFMLH